MDLAPLIDGYIIYQFYTDDNFDSDEILIS